MNLTFSEDTFTKLMNHSRKINVPVGTLIRQIIDDAAETFNQEDLHDEEKVDGKYNKSRIE